MFTTSKTKRATKLRTVTDNLNIIDQEHNVRKSLHLLQPSANDPLTLVGSSGAVIKQKELQQKDETSDSPLKIEEIQQKHFYRTRNSRRNKNVEDSKVSYNSSACEVENVLSPQCKSSITKPKNFKKCTKKLITKLKSSMTNDELKDEIISFAKPEIQSSTTEPSSANKKYAGTSHKSTDYSGNDLNTESDEAKVRGKSSDDCDEIQTPVSPYEHIPTDLRDLMNSNEVSDNYWKVLAEQRRIALEKALHENELLHDQLEVLETENMQLNLLVKEAEHFIESVKEMIGDT